MNLIYSSEAWRLLHGLVRQNKLYYILFVLYFKKDTGLTDFNKFQILMQPKDTAITEETLLQFNIIVRFSIIQILKSVPKKEL